MYIHQKQLENLKKMMAPNKVIVIYGPRRCGKTTLIKKFLEGIGEKYLLLSGEDIFVQQAMNSQSIVQLKNYIGDNKLLVIDEAQKIKNIGLNLKLIVDHIKDIQILVTGSSSFDLANHVGEPLTGRKFTLTQLPLSQMEIGQIENKLETEANLGNRLVFGSYPEIVLSSSMDEKVRLLKEIVGSYLYKDILEVEGLKYSDKIVKLLQLLAFQIGKEVSFGELGAQLGMSKNTIEKYLDLLQKTFVVFRLNGFSRQGNKRKEITKQPRYYFYDNGIRNALINNFNPIELRDDIGMLWENYIAIERLKKQEYEQIFSNNYFWRTYEKKEIDWIEERGGALYGYEIKWRQEKNKPPKEWMEGYKNSKYELINKDNYLEFIR